MSLSMAVVPTRAPTPAHVPGLADIVLPFFIMTGQIKAIGAYPVALPAAPPGRWSLLGMLQVALAVQLMTGVFRALLNT